MRLAGAHLIESSNRHRAQAKVISSLFLSSGGSRSLRWRTCAGPVVSMQQARFLLRDRRFCRRGEACSMLATQGARSPNLELPASICCTAADANTQNWALM